MKPLSEKYDKNNAILSIFAGAGEDDAKDWSEMLLRMYIKYAENRGWKVIALTEKEVEIRGDHSFGNLKKESGVHRLVRISPFSRAKLRHTSFALVDIVPELPDIEHQ